jgi:hypothetical protein
VLTIHVAQKEAFQRAVDRRFVRGVLEGIARAFPGHVASHPPDHWERVALAALERSRGHGLGGDREAQAFVSLAVLVHDRFDERPAMQRILAATDRSPGWRVQHLIEACERGDGDEAPG